MKGHDVGLQGYSHENPLSMTPEQEGKVLLKSDDLLTELAGKKPAGNVALWWELSNFTVQLLLKHSIKYDHSLMHNDFHCYYVRTGDKWHPIDYSKYDQGVFPMTIHPDVSGRPQYILMHERWIKYVNSHYGVKFCTMEEIADDFARTSKVH